MSEFHKYRRNAVKAAIELGYGDHVARLVAAAQSEFEIVRIMRATRLGELISNSHYPYGH